MDEDTSETRVKSVKSEVQIFTSKLL